MMKLNILFVLLFFLMSSLVHAGNEFDELKFEPAQVRDYFYEDNSILALRRINTNWPDSIAFRLSSDELQKRIIYALENKHVQVLHYPSGDYATEFGVVAIPAAKAKLFFKIIFKTQKKKGLAINHTKYNKLIKELSFKGYATKSNWQVTKTLKDYEIEAKTNESPELMLNVIKMKKRKEPGEICVDSIIELYEWTPNIKRTDITEQIKKMFSGRLWWLCEKHFSDIDYSPMAHVKDANIIGTISIWDVYPTERLFKNLGEFLANNASVTRLFLNSTWSGNNRGKIDDEWAPYLATILENNTVLNTIQMVSQGLTTKGLLLY